MSLAQDPLGHDWQSGTVTATTLPGDKAWLLRGHRDAQKIPGTFDWVCVLVAVSAEECLVVGFLSRRQDVDPMAAAMTMTERRAIQSFGESLGFIRGKWFYAEEGKEPRCIEVWKRMK